MRRIQSRAFAMALSTEAEVVDGKVSHEIEHMFYAKVTSPETLLRARSLEIQEQWGLWTGKSEKNVVEGSNRVRKTIAKQIVNGVIDNASTETQYVITTKVKRQDGTSLEIPLAASEDSLNAFRMMADSGMIKHRYRFPVPNSSLCWEVDMFVEPGESMFSTKYMPWCKIDLEVPTADTPIPDFPEGFTDTFLAKVAEPTPEQVDIINKLKGYLSLPNPHIQEVYKDVI